MLNNSHQLPFVVNVTCLAGFFAHPLEDAMGEHFIRQQNSGAIANFAACGAGSSSWQNSFNKSIFENLLAPEHRRVGTAIMATKIAMIARGLPAQELGMYNLLGDAAMKLALPRADLEGDLNSDGRVDILDLVIVGSNFGGRPSPFAHPNPDVNNDGVVNVFDLVIVAGNFGAISDNLPRFRETEEVAGATQ